MTEYRETRRSPIQFYEVVTQKYMNGCYFDEEYTYEAVGEFGIIESSESLSGLIKQLLEGE